MHEASHLELHAAELIRRYRASCDCKALSIETPSVLARADEVIE